MKSNRPESLLALLPRIHCPYENATVQVHANAMNRNAGHVTARVPVLVTARGFHSAPVFPGCSPRFIVSAQPAGW